MKRLFILCLMVTPVLSFGQDYQSVRSDFVHFFQQGEEISHGIKIDSVSLEGADTILVNYVTFRSPWNNVGYHYNAFGAYVPSWVGEKVIIKPNGENLFFNEYQDTIRLETQAQINDSWNLFNLDSISYIEGLVTSIDVEVLLDSTVEVKTISLQRKGFQGNPLSHPLNGKTIRLSKTLGIVQGVDFYRFPEDTALIVMVGMENPSREIHRLTRDEVYDFQVGDEFHYKRQEDPTGWPKFERRIHRVLSVTDNANQRAVEFIVFRHSSRLTSMDPFSEEIEFDTTLVSEIYLDLSSLIADAMPFQAAVMFDTTGVDTIHNEVQLYRSQLNFHDSGLESVTHTYNMPDLYITDSSGYWYPINWVSGIDNYIYDYGKGIGRTYMSEFRYDDGSNMSWDRKETLTYFKKGTTEWGTPYLMSLFLGVNELEDSKKQYVYPNPIKQGQVLTLGVDCNQVEVFDMTGKLILVEQNTESIQTKNLTAGIYLVKATTEEGTSVQQLVVTN